MVKREEFERLVRGEFERLPEKFRKRVSNVAVLVEDEPSAELRREEGLDANETLLGYYHGVPATERGGFYGVGPTLPDTITLFQKPIEEAAREESKEVREVVYETIWHEVAHYFGMDEDMVGERERRGKNYT